MPTIDTTINSIPNNIDSYIANYSTNVQLKLQELRATIAMIAPNATETIRYQMPTFTLYGNLVHFAAYKNHIGLYPSPSGIEAFKNELKPYKTSKGAIQFPIEQALPMDIIRKIVTYRVEENTAKENKKHKK